MPSLQQSLCCRHKNAIETEMVRPGDDVGRSALGKSDIDAVHDPDEIANKCCIGLRPSGSAPVILGGGGRVAWKVVDKSLHGAEQQRGLLREGSI